MSKYPIFQLVIEILSQAQGLLAKSYKHMTRQHNDEIGQNLITRTGGATLADFFVALTRDMFISFAIAPINQAQGRCLQLEKEGI